MKLIGPGLKNWTNFNSKSAREELPFASKRGGETKTAPLKTARTQRPIGKERGELDPAKGHRGRLTPMSVCTVPIYSPWSGIKTQAHTEPTMYNISHKLNDAGVRVACRRERLQSPGWSDTTPSPTQLPRPRAAMLKREL